MSNHVFSSESASRPGSASRNPGAPDAAAVTRPWLVPSLPDGPAAPHRQNPRREPTPAAGCLPSPELLSFPAGPAAIPAAVPAQRQTFRRRRPLGSPPGKPPRRHVRRGGSNNARTCCTGFPGPHRPAVPRQASGPRHARRGSERERGELAAGAALQHGPAAARESPSRGRPAERSAPRRQHRRCRRPGTKRAQAAGPAPPCAGLGPGQSRSGARYSPDAALRVPGLGGRGAEPGPARSGRAAVANLGRLAPPR